MKSSQLCLSLLAAFVASSSAFSPAFILTSRTTLATTRLAYGKEDPTDPINNPANDPATNADGVQYGSQSPDDIDEGLDVAPKYGLDPPVKDGAAASDSVKYGGGQSADEDIPEGIDSAPIGGARSYLKQNR